jgi:uncharacterized low-complexity protein
MAKHNKTLKVTSLAIGATFVATMAASSFANAANNNANPFAMSDLHSGYTQLADQAGDAKCGADKAKAEAKAKEGKCGGDKAKAKVKEGQCGGAKPAPKEGKCGGSK